MRAFILVAGACLALAACVDVAHAQAPPDPGIGLTAISVNDTTTINTNTNVGAAADIATGLVNPRLACLGFCDPPPVPPPPCSNPVGPVWKLKCPGANVAPIAVSAAAPVRPG